MTLYQGEIDEIQAMRRAGISIRQIRRETGYAYKTIVKYGKGLSPRKTWRARKGPTRKEAMEMYLAHKAGHSLRQIAKVVPWGIDTVRKYVRQLEANADMKYEDRLEGRPI